MSVSKLESLPNEVLVHIFEKYINGVDILVAFLHQQNQRFDALIPQCPRFNFDFFYCRKDDFRLCIGLLPAYVERIEELALSDQHTPGQIYAFLSFFPSFTAFKRLRKLYFQYNVEAADYSIVLDALQSLSNTNVGTVSIKAMNTEGVDSINSVIARILRLPSIKRFFFHNGLHDFKVGISDYIFDKPWEFTTGNSSKIEYLTILSIACGLCHLKSIFECAPQLKYLKVGINSRAIYEYEDKVDSSSSSINSIPTLHTLVLSFENEDGTTFDMLAPLWTAVPALRRLEIKAHRALLDASTWETLLQTSLPLLTHFNLHTTTSRIRETDIDTTLASFETPFWISKQNFYMILTKHQVLSYNGFGIYETHTNHPNEFNQPVVQWWIVPSRGLSDDIPTSGITSFGMSNKISCLSPNYDFKNIKNLAVYNLNQEVLQWLVTYVNYSQIKYLDVSSLQDESIRIASFLSCVESVPPLRIRYNQLMALRNVNLEKMNYLKYLDISVDEHSFDEKDINVISTLFSDIEHLAINTRNLSNIPLLDTYLPNLISLTYKILDECSWSSNYEQKLADYRLRQKVEFLFQRNGDWLTIWTDGVALKDSYWQTFSSNSS